ncbi:MAG: hypothetical protein AAGN35_21750 [Bacteroidota bacterium]
MAYSGHGTVISGGQAQGDARVHVNSNGGDTHYESGVDYDAINNTSENIEPGQVVFLEWDGAHVSVASIGKRAVGDVSANGTFITITDPGDTGLEGEVDISSGYDSFGGATEVSCADMDGAASYLE